jgi:hypothetical protein
LNKKTTLIERCNTKVLNKIKQNFNDSPILIIITGVALVSV